MTRYLIQLSIFIVGAFFGAYGYYMWAYLEVSDDNEASQLVSKVLAYAEREIPAENFHCESNASRKVGVVLSSIFGGSFAYKINPLSAGCSNGVCTITLSSCRPWQTSECGARILLFNQLPDGDVQPSSFKCMDVP